MRAEPSSRPTRVAFIFVCAYATETSQRNRGIGVGPSTMAAQTVETPAEMEPSAFETLGPVRPLWWASIPHPSKASPKISTLSREPFPISPLQGRKDGNEYRHQCTKIVTIIKCFSFIFQFFYDYGVRKYLSL